MGIIQYKKSDFGSLKVFTLTIENGQTTSNSIDLNGGSLVGILFPTMTSTTVTLQDSIDGVNFLDTYNTDGNILTFSIASNRHYKLVPSDCATFFNLKLKVGSAEGATRKIDIIVRGLA